MKIDRMDNDKIFFLKVIFTVFSLLFYSLMFFKSYEDKSVYYKVETRMPYCKACKKGKKIKPEFVDFEENYLAFIVHRNLKG